MFFKSPPELILASTSTYRRLLLERLGLAFQVRAPGVDEQPLAGESPVALVTRLARAKARAVAAQHPTAWVIGSDQVAVLDDTASGGAIRILGKPGTAERCAEQLQASSGKTLSFLTAVAVVRHDPVAGHEFLDTTLVRFRKLDPLTIARYVAAESPLDCAGGFKSEGLGISLCAGIDSDDPTALIGLPLIGLAGALRSAGWQIP